MREERLKQLPVEPDDNDSDITYIRFRCDDGTSFERRFRITDPLQVQSF